MRFTIEEHPGAMQRYRHVARAPRLGVSLCTAVCPGTKRSCTRRRGHRGPHVAHGFFGKVLAVWDSGATVPATRRRAGPPDRRRPRLSIRHRLSALAASPQDLIFLLLFLAFVGFAVHWLLLIAG